MYLLYCAVYVCRRDATRISAYLDIRFDIRSMTRINVHGMSHDGMQVNAWRVVGVVTAVPVGRVCMAVGAQMRTAGPLEAWGVGRGLTSCLARCPAA